MIWGCPNCRIKGETGDFPVITVAAQKYDKITGDSGVGHNRIVCSTCSGPLQALSKNDLQSDRFKALDENPEQMLAPSFLDLVIDDKRECAGEPPVPPADRTSGNGAGVTAPTAGKGATVSSTLNSHSSLSHNLGGAEQPASPLFIP